MTKNRLEAFSDGVLAIIITIMVLELKLPEGTTIQALLPTIPGLVSYVLSFLFVAVYWGNHHHLVSAVKSLTPGIIWANHHLLFWTSLIPFATNWMGENHFAAFPTAVYALLMLICGVAYNILAWQIRVSNPTNEHSQKAFQAGKIKGLASLAGYGAAFPLAFVNSYISLSLFFLVAFLWIIPDHNFEKAVEGSENQD